MVLAAGCAKSGAFGVVPVVGVSPLGDGHELRLVLDSCHGGPYQINTSETDDEVTVRVEGRAVHDDTCADLAEAELCAPLAGRRVVDGAGHPLSLSAR